MSMPLHPAFDSTFDYQEGLNELTAALNGVDATPGALELAQQVIQLGGLLLRQNAVQTGPGAESMEVFPVVRPSKADEVAARMNYTLAAIASGPGDPTAQIAAELHLAADLVLHSTLVVRAAQPPPSASVPTSTPESQPF